MGGQEGSKGYLYQSIVALYEVFNKFDKEDYSFVYMEYPSENDKVDIAFKNEDNELYVIQVKSSRNNFTIPNINKWLSELIDDKSDAKQFELILIGNVDSKVRDFINSIDKLSKGINDKICEGNKSKIYEKIINNILKVKVTLLTDNMKIFEGAIESNLNLLFFDKGIQGINPRLLKLMVESMGYMFNKFCTNASFISKEEFYKKILDWAMYNWDLNKPVISGGFNIGFYRSNEFYKKNPKIKLEVLIHKYKESNMKIKENNKILYDKIMSVEAYIEKVEEIKINSENKLDLREIISTNKQLTEVQESSDKLKKLSKITTLEKASFNHGFWKKVIIKEENINTIKKYLNRENLECKDTFFDLGDLKENIVPCFNNPYRPTRNSQGSEVYDKKEDNILELYNNIIELNENKNIIEYLSQYKDFYLCPFYIENKNNKIIRNIHITLKLSKNINILKCGDIQYPGRMLIDRIEEIFKSLFIRKSDSNVKQFTSKKNSRQVKNLELSYINRMMNPETAFYDNIDEYFKYNFYDNDEEVFVLEFEIDQLKPLEKIYFPTTLILNNIKVGDKISIIINSELNPNEIIELEL